MAGASPFVCCRKSTNDGVHEEDWGIKLAESTSGLYDNFLFVYLYFVAGLGTVYKSSAHDAQLKTGVILSPLQDARIKVKLVQPS